jgi:hypothetical protein
MVRIANQSDFLREKFLAFSGQIYAPYEAKTTRARRMCGGNCRKPSGAPHHVSLTNVENGLTGGI